MAENFNSINKKRKANIENHIKKICIKIKKINGKIKPSLKIKLMFNGIRLVRKKINISEEEHKYWLEKGWLNERRPWKI